ncbi:MAG: hypothetical protein MI754_18970 [Chromatiales bacterium]|nr:hypothetical protein [Chromatiales bacterium]
MDEQLLVRPTRLQTIEEFCWLAPVTLVSLFLHTFTPNYLFNTRFPEWAHTINRFSPDYEIVIMHLVSGVLSSLPLGLLFGMIFQRRIPLYGLLSLAPVIVIALSVDIFSLLVTILAVGVYIVMFIGSALLAKRYLSRFSPLKVEIRQISSERHQVIFMASAIGASLAGSALVVYGYKLVSEHDPNSMYSLSFYIVLVMVSLPSYLFSKSGTLWMRLFDKNHR